MPGGAGGWKVKKPDLDTDTPWSDVEMDITSEKGFGEGPEIEYKGDLESVQEAESDMEGQTSEEGASG